MVAALALHKTLSHLIYAYFYKGNLGAIDAQIFYREEANFSLLRFYSFIGTTSHDFKLGK